MNGERKPGSGNNDFTDDLLYPFLTPLVEKFVPAWVTPNSISFVGFIFSMAAAATLFLSSSPTALPITAFFIFIWNIVDSCDGIQARLTNQKSKFGAFFDPYLDVLSELFIFMGLLVYFHANNYVYIFALMSRFAYKTALAFFMICLGRFYVSKLGQGTANLILVFFLLWQYFLPFNWTLNLFNQTLVLNPIGLYFLTTIINIAFLFVHLIIKANNELKN